MKSLIIGSNSFSGASFCKHLLEKDIEVIGISRSPEYQSVFLPYKWLDGDKQNNFQFVTIDLNKDLDQLKNLLNQYKPTHIYNFAAQSMVGESWKHPEHWMQTNVVSLVKLQELLRNLDFLEKYIHITTPEVYGSTDGWISENTPFNPTTPYAVSRAAGDMSLKSYFGAYSFPVVFTRAANVYGPGQQLYRIIPRTILFLLLGKKLQLHGGGMSTRSFIHMDDVSTATLNIGARGIPGETYHISTLEIITIRELVQKICQKLSKNFDESVEVTGERLGKDAAYWLNSEKIRNQLNWADEISLDKGIDDCINWVEANLSLLKELPMDYMHKP